MKQALRLCPLLVLLLLAAGILWTGARGHSARKQPLGFQQRSALRQSGKPRLRTLPAPLHKTKMPTYQITYSSNASMTDPVDAGRTMTAVGFNIVQDGTTLYSGSIGACPYAVSGYPLTVVSPLTGTPTPILATLPSAITSSISVGVFYTGGVFTYSHLIYYGGSYSLVTAPTVALSASPANIFAGGSSALTWSSTNATTVDIPGVGTGLAPSGSASVSPGSTTSYTATATGAGPQPLRPPSPSLPCRRSRSPSARPVGPAGARAP